MLFVSKGGLISLDNMHFLFVLGIPKLPVSAQWYPNDPSLAFFPFPAIDLERPWGSSDCKSCPGKICTGHYVTDITKLNDMYSNGKAVRAIPPSKVIQEYIQKSTGNITELAGQCCLSVEEVKIWIQHLKTIAENRRRGAEKAKQTRLKN